MAPWNRKLRQTETALALEQDAYATLAQDRVEDQRQHSEAVAEILNRHVAEIAGLKAQHERIERQHNEAMDIANREWAVEKARLEGALDEARRASRKWDSIIKFPVWMRETSIQMAGRRVIVWSPDDPTYGPNSPFPYRVFSDDPHLFVRKYEDE